MAQNSPKLIPAPRLICVELNPGPGRGHEWSEERRWEIITKWNQEGKSIHAIAKELGIDRRNVKRLIEKYKETGSVERRSGQGRKRKLTRKVVRQMKQKAKRGKKATEITRDYNVTHENEGKTVGVHTVRRELKREGLKYLVNQEREELSPDHIAKRLAYSRKMLQYDWSQVLFTDEKTFPLGVQPLKASLISLFRFSRLKKLARPSRSKNSC